MREPAQQHWPMLKKRPKLAHLTAWSMSASAKTMFGDLPPSSTAAISAAGQGDDARVTRLRLEAAAAFMIWRPTRVEPVKATFWMSMCSAMAWPCACQI